MFSLLLRVLLVIFGYLPHLKFLFQLKLVLKFLFQLKEVGSVLCTTTFQEEIFEDETTAMVFTANQNTQFFTSNAQMALTPDQRNALRRQALETVQDLVDFKQDELKVAFRNARTSLPGTPAIPAVPAVPAVMLDGNVIQAAVPAIADVPSIPAIHPVPILARSTMRLLIAAVAFHYYRVSLKKLQEILHMRQLSNLMPARRIDETHGLLSLLLMLGLIKGKR